MWIKSVRRGSLGYVDVEESLCSSNWTVNFASNFRVANIQVKGASCPGNW